MTDLRVSEMDLLGKASGLPLIATLAAEEPSPGYPVVVDLRPPEHLSERLPGAVPLAASK